MSYLCERLQGRAVDIRCTVTVGTATTPLGQSGIKLCTCPEQTGATPHVPADDQAILAAADQDRRFAASLRWWKQACAEFEARPTPSNLERTERAGRAYASEHMAMMMASQKGQGG